MLCDSGNRSLDLINQEIWDTIFPHRKLKPANEFEIQTADSTQTLKVLGRAPNIPIYVEGLTKPWITSPLVIANLGSAGIWSAGTMARFPIKPDLQQGIAYVGANAVKVSLYADQDCEEDDENGNNVWENQSSPFIEDVPEISSVSNNNKNIIADRAFGHLDAVNQKSDNFSSTKDEENLKMKVKPLGTMKPQTCQCFPEQKPLVVNPRQESLVGPTTMITPEQEMTQLAAQEVKEAKKSKSSTPHFTSDEEAAVEEWSTSDGRKKSTSDGWKPSSVITGHRESVEYVSDELWEVKVLTTAIVAPGNPVLVPVRLKQPTLTQSKLLKSNVGLFVPFNDNLKFKSIQIPVECYRSKDDNEWIAEVPVWNWTDNECKLPIHTLLGLYGPIIEKEQTKKKSKVSCTKGKPCKTPFEGLDPEEDVEVIKSRLCRLVNKNKEELDKAFTSEKKKSLNAKFDDQINQNELLTSSEQELVLYLLHSFSHCLSENKFDSGETSLIEYSIDTSDAKPITHKTRPMNPFVKEAWQETERNWREQGIIEPCESPWSSPLVPVKKKDGSYRFAVDYRALNQVTKMDSFPVASSLELLSNYQLSSSKYFISVDLTGAYLAVRVSPDSQDKLAICSPTGTFRFLRMPFGSRNCAQTYQRLMQRMFRRLWSEDHLLSFFDDHLLPGNNFLMLLYRFAQFLMQIEFGNLRISPSKTKLFVQRCTFLGHEIGKGSIAPADKLTKAIEDWPQPKDLRGLRSFLGTSGYYRRYIKNYASIVQPLTALTKKDNPWKWSVEEEKAFNEIKMKLISKPLLVAPNFESKEPFILDSDSSGFAVGAVLSQKQADGAEKPIAYFSKTLSKEAMNYHITRKELLAIMLAMEHFQFFLLGRKFLIRTDHRALQWIKKTKALNSQLFRWSERIQNFDFEIVYKQGSALGNADGLSRMVKPEVDVPEMTKEDCNMYKELGIPIPKSGPIHEALSNAAVTTRQKKKQQEQEKVKVKVTINPEPLEMIEDKLPNGKSKSKSKVNNKKEEDESKVNKEEDESKVNKEEDESKVSKEEDDSKRSKTKHGNLEDMVEHGTCQCLDELPQDFAENYVDNKPQVLKHKVIKKFIKQDRCLSKVIQWKEENHKPGQSEVKGSLELQQYRRMWNELVLEDGKLFAKKSIIDPFVGEEIQCKRIVIPKGLRTKIIYLLHVHPLSGHQGFTRTYNLAKRIVYWPNMGNAMRAAIDSCSACLQAKEKTRKETVLLGQTSTEKYKRLNTFYTDLVGPWPTTDPRDPKWILTFQDAVTKYPECALLKSTTADEVMKATMETLVVRYGSGLTLVSDNGPQFKSETLREACKRLGVCKIEISAFNPMSNPVERMHRTLENTIRALMTAENATAGEWYKFVPYALAAIRHMPLSNLPGSPHELAYGQSPMTAAEVYLEEVNQPLKSPTMETIVQRFRKMPDVIRQQQQINHERNKDRYDKSRSPVDIKEGDWVYVHGPGNAKEAGNSRKLLKYYDGPFRVLKVLNDTCLRIRTRSGRTVINRRRVRKVPPSDLSKVTSPVKFPAISNKQNPVKFNQRENVEVDTSNVPIPSHIFNVLNSTHQSPTINLESTANGSVVNDEDVGAPSSETANEPVLEDEEMSLATANEPVAEAPQDVGISKDSFMNNSELLSSTPLPVHPKQRVEKRRREDTNSESLNEEKRLKPEENSEKQSSEILSEISDITPNFQTIEETPEAVISIADNHF